MKLLHITLLTMIIAAATPVTVMAQDARTLEQLSDLNRMNPLQNPKYERWDRVVGRKLIDRKNKVVGKVEDIIINDNGTIASMKADFSRMRLGDNVYLNYRSMRIRANDNAFELGLDADELEEFFPEFLANIETASGDNEDTFSVRKLVGTKLYSEKGKKIGEIENILFGNSGSIVRAIYVELSYGTLRGETLAIPFRNVEFKSKQGRLQGYVSNGFVDAMTHVADN